MNRIQRVAPATIALLMAACAQAPVMNAVLPGQDVVVVGPQEGGRSLRLGLALSPQQAYALLADAPASGVHRWVAADLTRYDVELKSRNASSGFDSLTPPLVAQVPIGAGGAGSASFTRLAAGPYYRAYVKAMGRVGGASGSGDAVQINTQASSDFADFDFTANNDVVAEVSRTVAVHLDNVAFSGGGHLAFGSVSPGAYASPSGPPSITVIPASPGASTAPSPSPSPSASVAPSPSPSPQGPVTQATYTVGDGPKSLTLDDQGNLWVANSGGNTVTKLSNQGVALGTYSVGTQPNDLKFDPSGRLWVVNMGSDNVSVLASDGTHLATYTVGDEPYSLEFNTNGQVWVSNARSYSLSRITSAGSALSTLSGSGGSFFGTARNSAGDIWVVTTFNRQGRRYSSAGSFLGTFFNSVSPLRMAFEANGQAWVVNHTQNHITHVASDGSMLTTLALSGAPSDVAVDAQGRVWVSLNQAHQVAQLTSMGSLMATFSVGFSPWRVLVDATLGCLWVANQSSDTVTRLPLSS